MSCKPDRYNPHENIIRFLEEDVKYTQEASTEFRDRAIFEAMVQGVPRDRLEIIERTRFLKNQNKFEYSVTVREHG